MGKKKIVMLLLALFLVLLSSTALAGGGTNLAWHLFSGGGGHAQTGNIVLDSTFGQPFAGISHSVEVSSCSGFLCFQYSQLDLRQRVFIPAITNAAY